MQSFWTLDPGVAVGPFVFGENPEELIEELQLKLLAPDCATADWQTYAFPGLESRLAIQGGTILGIDCADVLYFHGTNLIGLPTVELRRILGVENRAERDPALGFILYYDKLGLMVITSRGLVESISCNRIMLEEE